tara:strand:+ start:3772 stop:4584 length:813 start_codon:yes stop_codon:yes gene_type:complete
MKKIGLIVKNQDNALILARKIFKYLKSIGYVVYIDEDNADKINLKNECRIDEMNVDIYVVLGGDGTVLKTVSKAKNKNTPIFGINFGTKGFLTQINPKNWKKAIKAIIHGKYLIESRLKLDILLNNHKVGSALNECVIITSIPVKILDISLYIDGELVQNIKSDGIIVSTPTGSTAYSKSCGGPIVDPKLNSIIITPICPFESSNKSLVINQDSKIEINTLDKSSPFIVIDGKKNKKLPSGAKVSINISKDKVNFIHFGGSFYQKIKDKL